MRNGRIVGAYDAESSTTEDLIKDALGGEVQRV